MKCQIEIKYVDILIQILYICTSHILNTKWFSDFNFERCFGIC